MHRAFAFVRAHKLLTLGVVAIMAIGGVVLIRSGGRSPYATVTVERGSVVLAVSVTGATEPVTAINVAFERGGRIVRAPVKIGDRVSAGQVLAELDKTELAAQLAEANANAAVQEAKLAELRSGTRPEDVRVKETELAKAEQDLANDYQSAFDVLNDAHVKSDDAVRKQADDLFSNDDGASPQLTFAITNSQTEIDAEYKRRQATLALESWSRDLNELLNKPTDRGLIDRNIAGAKAHLLVIRSFLDTSMDAVLVSAGLSAATIASYKANITTGRTNVATAIASVTAQEQKISSQKITVAKIADELSLKKAGSRPEEIAAQEALLAKAEASVRVIQAQIAKSALYAPVSGTVTRQDAKIGQIAPANVTLIAIISEGELEIKANVPEADIAKVSIGNPVEITFDAYGSEVEFRGRVTFIEPAETVIEGVPTYVTTVMLDHADSRVRPGMTANLEIISATRENVIFVPQRSVATRSDGGRFVRVLPDAARDPVERTVTVGLRGSSGVIEIASGLTAGEKVLRSPEE